MRRLLLVCFLVMVAACGSSGTPSSPTTTPSDAIRDGLEWYIDVLNGETALTHAEFEQRFHQTYRERITFSEFRRITDEIATNGPFSLGPIDHTNPLEWVAELDTDTDRLLVQLAVDEDGLIVGLHVEPAAPDPLDDPPPTIEEAIAKLEPVGEVDWLAAEVNGDTCTPISGNGADELVPVGSAINLWILAAVADAIESGELSWDEEVVITQAIKSLPPGELQNRTDGSTVSVRDAATLMVANSDNTATDLLLSLVTREGTELTLAKWGHSDPTANTPFLSTREIFLLKLSQPSIADEYTAADTATRRELLNQLLGRSLSGLPLGDYLTNPAYPDRIEWFATPTDMCNIMAKLLVEGESVPGMAPLIEILTTNPGVPNDDRWAQVAYREGTEPGLLHTTWVMDTLASDRYAFVATVVNPDDAFDPSGTLATLAAARDLVGG